MEGKYKIFFYVEKAHKDHFIPMFYDVYKTIL